MKRFSLLFVLILLLSACGNANMPAPSRGQSRLPTRKECGRYNQNMPTVKIIGRHRFYFFSKENNEPPHIHVESAENAAKFWISPIELDWAVGYNSKELRQVRELVEEHVEFFLEKWYEQPKNT
jgi:hypothetical protein